MNWDDLTFDKFETLPSLKCKMSDEKESCYRLCIIHKYLETTSLRFFNYLLSFSS